MIDKRTVYADLASETPLGPIWIAVSEDGLAAVEFQVKDHLKNIPEPVHLQEEEFVRLLQRRGFGAVILDAGKTAAAAGQICEYLQGQRRSFALPIDWSAMGDFQARVLQATLAVPFGQVTTYAAIAQQVGSPGAARAVGRAEATNPMPLVIPCHRVVGRDGKLHGYGGPGGIPTKAWLLKMEGIDEATITGRFAAMRSDRAASRSR